MTCDTCEFIEAREGIVIYSDPHSHVVLPESPATKGHVRVYSKEHASSLDELSHDQVQHLLQVGNLAATLLFENLEAQGTNVIMNEGDLFGEHLHLDVVARNEDDSLDTSWESVELPDSKMEKVQKRIKDKADLIGEEVETERNEVPREKPDKETMEDDEENYLIKQLRKLP